ncbi:TPA: hypothetical protein ACOD99_000084 [Stenotrophomonas maltophilia]
MKALSVCWWLGKECVPDWGAWAAAAAIFAGVGSWGAAIATYMAVISPLKRRKLEDKASTRVAMENFAGDLVSLRNSLGGNSFIVAMVAPKIEVKRHTDMVRRMTHSVVVPEVFISPENEALALALNKLRRSINEWNSIVTRFDLEPDPDLGIAYVEHEITVLKAAHAKLAESIREVARMIKPLVTSYAVELDRVLVNHNGFLIYPEVEANP